MCKCCQSCLESLYWNCCEERFCWDDSIAQYKEWETDSGLPPHSRGLHNGGASLESLPVTRQPVANNNNNHLQFDYQDSRREVLVEVPILAPNIYQVFSKSMIFKDDPEFKKLELEDKLINNNSKKTNGYYHGNVGKVVSFKDQEKDEKEPEVEEKPFSDFEIMFQDELYKIEEEDEDKPKSPDTPDVGISMKAIEETSSQKTIDRLNSTDSPKLTPEKLPEKVLPEKGVQREDSSKNLTRVIEPKLHLPRAKSALSLPRNDSVKSFTRSNSRQDLMITRSNSRQDLMITRSNSRQDLIKRVDSAKNLKNILARLPERSASFLSVPDLIDPDQPNKSHSEEVFTISSLEIDSHPSGEYSLISRMPDTPVIKGAKFPKFFAETPDIPEYKVESSLQSIAKTPDVIFTEVDFSMPRYYGQSKNIVRLSVPEPNAQTSKSMPDLNEVVTDKVSKRLVKIRSRLKPLVIKKHDTDTRHSNQDLNKF